MTLKPCIDCGNLIRDAGRCRACLQASPYQTSAWRRLALHVVRRDGACVRCGSGFMLSAHHVIPRAEGGPDHPSNLETLCVRCHAQETANDR
jgi:5-methylcytosine-specific restriction endonuclease McrA